VSTPGLVIDVAAGPADIDHIRNLFREYQTWLGVDLDFQGFDAELKSLPGMYAPPGGRLLLVRLDDEVVGGVGMRPLDDGICEMKRMYVRPSSHGKGAGRKLAEAIVDAALEEGYVAMRLDTLTRLDAAIALYRSMGFAEIPAYYDNPLDGVLYLELDLRSADAAISMSPHSTL
jgi:GNAT superfamily N-acetyltransferase